MTNENKNSLVEEALLQMKALEEAVTENAKGILASTMKEEISELVKESLSGTKTKSRLSEQEDEEEDVEDIEIEDEPVDDEEEVDFEMSDVSDEDEDDQEFDMSMLGSDMEDEEEMAPLDMRGASPEELAKVFKAMGEDDGIIISKDDDYIHLSDENEDVEYLIQNESDNSFEDETMESYDEEEDEVVYELEMDEEEDSDLEEGEEEVEETIYELEMDEQEDEEEEFESVYESSKPKGKVGKMKPFKYPKMKHGVTETSDEENESEWKEEEMEEASNLFLKKPKMRKEVEAKESSRTLGVGRSHGRNGLPKPRTYSSHVKLESYNKEIEVLREKNEEYKKALDFFRTKLNEVAVFNSNLAYATRLFTEHTTTKQEKINILRRFDNVESMKESKGLYKTIKEELDGTTKVVTESVAAKVIKTPTTGSSNLIESKTYENPQFLRMKDLMNKIK